MNTTEPTTIEPVAGCSPSDGLPRQGRRGESHGGSGKDAVSAAVPGISESEGAAAKHVFWSLAECSDRLMEMLDLISIHPDELSLKQFWCDCERLEAQLKDLKAVAVIHLANDFPAFVRGYKDIPE